MKAITSIKTGFLKKKNNHSAGRDVRLKLPEQFRSVLIIAEHINEEWMKNVARVFKNAEIKSLSTRAKKEDVSTLFRHTLHHSDFSLTGVLKNDKLKTLFNTHFDLIVDLSGDSELLNYFLRGIRSDLVIGKFGAPNEEWHDLLLEPGDNDDYFLLTIEKQLNLLGHGHRKI